MSTQVCVVGIVATEPKLVVTTTGITLCSFRLASSERRYDRATEEWVEGDTNWFNVTAFRALGEHVKDSFEKGNRVIVSGKLKVRQWEHDGKQGTAVDIDADALGHELRWGTTQFTKDVTVGNASSNGSAGHEAGTQEAGTQDTGASSEGDVPHPERTRATEGDDRLQAWANPAMTAAF